jgi:hypothetical protein
MYETKALPKTFKIFQKKPFFFKTCLKIVQSGFDSRQLLLDYLRSSEGFCLRMARGGSFLGSDVLFCVCFLCPVFPCHTSKWAGARP